MRQLTRSVALLILAGFGDDVAPGGGTGTTPTQPVVPVPTGITLTPKERGLTSVRLRTTPKTPYSHDTQLWLLTDPNSSSSATASG
jgi:hypothetical protein